MFFAIVVQLKVMKVLLASILFILCHPEKKEQPVVALFIDTAKNKPTF
jgi:hypothetical protein